MSDARAGRERPRDGPAIETESDSEEKSVGGIAPGEEVATALNRMEQTS